MGLGKAVGRKPVGRSEWARGLGAQLDIDATPGRGTSVRLVVPRPATRAIGNPEESLGHHHVGLAATSGRR